jgi:hypothetical protein
MGSRKWGEGRGPITRPAAAGHPLTRERGITSKTQTGGEDSAATKTPLTHRGSAGRDPSEAVILSETKDHGI